MRWYYRPAVVIVALLAVGPFALPLVIMSPAFTKPAKIVITILVVALTVWMVKMSVDIYLTLLKYLQDLQNVYSH